MSIAACRIVAEGTLDAVLPVYNVGMDISPTAVGIIVLFVTANSDPKPPLPAGL